MVEPRITSGLRDYLPEDMIPRQQMLDTIREVFEQFGFVPLATPALEQEDILTGGDPYFKMLIFKTHVPNAPLEKLALRFDLTVPLARVVAQYPKEIKKPFKRYQVGPVWRGEKPQAGRYREFIQFDADTVGSYDMMADAEIIAIMYETMTALNVPGFLIRVNNRKILNGLATYAGFDSTKTDAVLRTIDKLDRHGWELVRIDLAVEEKLGGPELSESQVRAIQEFVELRGSDSDILAGVATLMRNSPVALEGVEELQRIREYCEALGVPGDRWAIDLSVARGLGYYTGPVFETVLTDLRSIGSVFSGGRYDDLVSRFSPVTIPATGASVGVDRLFTAMQELGLVKATSSVAEVMVFNFDPLCRAECQRLATQLRRGGLKTEIYTGPEITLRGQLSHAVRQEIPVAVILGSDEVFHGTVKVKDLSRKRQFDVPRGEIITTVSNILNP